MRAPLGDKWLGLVALLICGLACAPLPLSGAVTSQQRTLARTAEVALKKAGNLYRSKKFSEAGDALREAQQSVDQLSSDASDDAASLVAPLVKQLARARTLLEAEGVKLPPGKAIAKDPAGASFTRQVAPILLAKCGSCHVQRSRGGLNMSTYVALAKGSQNGTVIMSGDAKGSRLVELVESGDMPRGGGKVSAEELALLVSWIDGGARFDGPDSAAPLTSFASAQTPAGDQPNTKLKVVAASGKEEVQFARDLGPVLLEHCVGCHGEQNPRNNFSMATFNRLLQGGDNGPVLVPGKPAESLLLKKLLGMAGARMPFEQPALAPEVVAKVEKWIALGGKYDGSDPALALDEVVAVSIAQNSNHEQLMRNRAELAARNWRLILPDAQAHHEETPNVLVYGSVSPETLADVGRAADEQVTRLRKLFKVPADEPFVKGRLTLYVFDKRYDYGEVGTMLEHREIPSTWRGHWRHTLVDAYGCLLLNSDGDVSPGLVTQQVAGAYVASLGKIPHWFSEGTARAVAAHFEPKEPRIKLWDDQIARILHSSAKLDAFLTTGLPPEDNDILSYSYAKFLMSSPARHAALIAALQQQTPFEQAFARIYGAEPKQLVDAWAARATKKAR